MWRVFVYMFCINHWVVDLEWLDFFSFRIAWPLLDSKQYSNLSYHCTPTCYFQVKQENKRFINEPCIFVCCGGWFLSMTCYWRPAHPLDTAVQATAL